MLILKRDTFSVESDSALVTAEEAATVNEAVRIIAAAKAEAAGIIRSAQDEYEAQRTRGYEDGLSKANAETLKRHVDLVAEADEYLRHAEREMSAVVLHALRRCIGEIGEPAIVEGLVRQGLERVAYTQRLIKVYVPDAAFERVKAGFEELRRKYVEAVSLELFADSELTGTRCRIETEAGIVHGAYDEQVAAIDEAMRKRFESRS